MAATTLYEDLSVRVVGTVADRGRTERTAAIETIDRDRMVVDLYAELAQPAAGCSPVGRTEETKARGETVDRDRAGETISTVLVGPVVDLYGALAQPARSAAVDYGETAITRATETIDWDQPPDLPYT